MLSMAVPWHFDSSSEQFRDDPWKFLVITMLLNVEKGRAAVPVFKKLLETYPTARALSKGRLTVSMTVLYRRSIEQSHGSIRKLTHNSV